MFCPIKFGSRIELNKHVVKAHEKTNICPFCSIWFGTIYGLNTHLKRVHEGKESNIQDAYLTSDDMINNSNQDISEMILPD